MASRRKTRRLGELPFAPEQVEGRIARKCIRMGKRDAKKYKNLMDFTRTHGVMFFDKRPMQMQERVNEWYEYEAGPLLQGISRINVDLHTFEIRLDRLKKRDDRTGRQRRRTAGEVESVERDIMNFEAQRRTNLQRGFALRRRGISAINSWSNYRDECAILYTRARAMASNVDVSSVQSEVPPFAPVELKVIPEFEPDTADDDTPLVGPESPRRGMGDVGRHGSDDDDDVDGTTRLTSPAGGRR